jgi:cbb3-type cytochrome oxidase subunit 3
MTTQSIFIDQLLHRLPRRGWVYALLAALYVIAVASFLGNVENIFPHIGNEIFAAIGMLLLFVSSAAVMGLLFLGMPVWLYLEGNKTQAARMLLEVVTTFLLITVGFLLTLVLISSVV